MPMCPVPASRPRHRAVVTVACAALVALLAWPAPARAGGAEEVLLAGADTLGEGTLDQALLDADGVVRPGPVFQPVDLGTATAWAALDHAGATWIGTGNQGRLVRVVGEEVVSIDLAPGLLVTAVAPLPGGAVAAAVFPGGRIVRVQVQAGQTTVTPLAALPVEHVWGLTADAAGTLTAATGGPGALFSIDALGTVTRRAALDDDHARCLVADGDGWLVGTAPKGLVLRVDAAGQATVLHDLEPQEVVGVLRLADRSLLIAANADEAGGNAQAVAGIVKQLAAPQPTAPGQKPQQRPALQDGHLLHLEVEGILTTLWTEEKVALLGLARDGDGAVAGTGPGGRLVRVAPGTAAAVLGDLPEAEASVVLSGADGRLDRVVTSNPAVLHRRTPSTGGGTWTSSVLDAQAVARWGQLRAVGRNLGGIAVRGGPSSEPDATWSAWRTVDCPDGLVGDADLRARFAQVRVTVTAADSELRSIAWIRRGPNHAPVLTDFAVGIPGAPKEGGPPSEPTPKRDLTWKAEDADGDDLVTRIEVRRVGVERWHVLVEDEELGKTAWTWDTTGWPDGLYDVRLVVTDAAGNPPERARRAQRDVVSHRVDNTPPVVTVAVARDGEGTLVLRGTVQDPADGRVVRVRASLDGGPWMLVAAEDGLYDEQTEDVVLRLPQAGPGAHDVVVQAVDALGNVGAAAAVLSR